MTSEDQKNQEYLKQIRTKVEHRRTICEIHREMYDIFDEQLRDSPHYQQLVGLLEDAYLIAKKMDAKLMQYKFNYNADWYERETKERKEEKLALRSKRKV